MTTRAGLAWITLMATALAAGCSDGGTPASETSNATQQPTPTPQTCTAVFRWLQKDAYKETAGVTEGGLWPPHTTTTLDLECSGNPTRSAFMANHGTEPDATDAEGAPILTEVDRLEVAVLETDADALFAAYEGCSCESETTFLSLDALDEGLVGQLVQEVSIYLDANLSCPNGVQAVIDDLQEGNIEGVLDALPACTWADGTDLASGMDQALQALVEATSETLADYHVCNNDAQLQAQLFRELADGGMIAPCNAAQDICRSPAWFYTP